MNKESLNQNWTLKRSIGTIMASLMGGGGEAETVNLPHDAMRDMDRSADAASGPDMAYFHGGNVEYTKKVFIPAEEKERVHYLNFDGIYMNATILVNGMFVAKHHYGYSPVTIRIDEYLHYGEENTICVQVRGDALPNSRWYPGQGIYRDAWILTGNYLHIVNDGVHATTESCDEEVAALMFETEIFNAGAASRNGYAELFVCDPQGKAVAFRRAKFYVGANDRVLVRERISLPNPELWDVDHPSVYTCTVALTEDGVVTDSADASFGIRTLRLDSIHGLRVNGKSVKLKGGCVHHDNGVLGVVSLKDAEFRRVKLLKEGGYNAIRTSHNPPSAALLEACDRLGLYVMHEFTDVWTQTKALYDYAEYMPECWEADVESVVKRDYNHPSVIMWSIGNEIPETGNMISAQWGRKLVNKFKELDHTRFVTNGINVMVSCAEHMQEMMEKGNTENPVSDGVNDILGDVGGGIMNIFSQSDAADPYVEESCDMLDLIGYNYTTARYEREHKTHPDWIFFGSETFSAALDENWDVISRNSYVIGDFSWTAWDYLGEAGCGRIEPAEKNPGFLGSYPWIAASDGDFDLTGYRRPMSYWRQIVWGGGNHKPYIAVHRIPNYGRKLYVSSWNMTDAVRSWTWPGYEGKTTAIEVYSDVEEVELYVNGKSLGKKPVGDDFKKFYCRWEAEYQPGEIVAVAYIDGKEVGRDILSTAGDSSIVLSPEKTSLHAGSNDLCYLAIEMKDRNGILDTSAQADVKVEVSGPAILAGCGSAVACTEEKYSDNTHALFEGRALAVIKAGDSTGKAVITVTPSVGALAQISLEIL